MRCHVTLTHFLLDRLGEEEALAQKVGEGWSGGQLLRWEAEPHWQLEKGCRCLSCWEYREDGAWDVNPIQVKTCPDHGCDDLNLPEDLAQHIALWDPQRVITEVHMKTSLIARHQPEKVENDFGDPWLPDRCRVCHEMWPCSELKTLAIPYVNHADFKKEWSV